VCGAFGTFAHQAYAARLRGRLNSNYKGFPICQAILCRDGSRSDSSRKLASVSDDASVVAMNRSRVRTGSTTSGHRRSSSAADPDARRARGPHSLAEVRTSRFFDLIRYSAHRSNLDARVVTRRCIRCVSGLRVVGCGGLAVDASRRHDKRFALYQYRPPRRAGVLRSDRDHCLSIANPFGLAS
jgi:hypothetical protein